MKPETRRRMYDALTTASELIRSQSELGNFPDEMGEEDEEGLEELNKCFIRASKLIKTLANKYK